MSCIPKLLVARRTVDLLGNTEDRFPPALLGLRCFKLRWHKRAAGQASIEFMSIMAIALSLLVVVTMISIGREQMIVSEREDLLAWRTAMTAAKEINLAASFGNGYERNFTLPPRILTTGYNFSVSNQSLLLTIRWRNSQIYEQITTSNISTVPRSGNNRIRNENGVIIID